MSGYNLLSTYMNNMTVLPMGFRASMYRQTMGPVMPVVPISLLVPGSPASILSPMPITPMVPAMSVMPSVPMNHSPLIPPVWASHYVTEPFQLSATTLMSQEKAVEAVKTDETKMVVGPRTGCLPPNLTFPDEVYDASIQAMRPRRKHFEGYFTNRYNEQMHGRCAEAWNPDTNAIMVISYYSAINKAMNEKDGQSRQANLGIIEAQKQKKSCQEGGSQGEDLLGMIKTGS